MGHSISGVIAPKDTLAGLSGTFGTLRYAELEQGFAFLPLDDSDLGGIIDFDLADSIGRFGYLTPALLALLEKASTTGGLAYVETEYFGGMGNQGAAAFLDGSVALEPEVGIGSINKALAVLGAKMTSGSFDLFDAIGLDRYRSNRRAQLMANK
ncbi:MAG: hypothetical protein AAGE05_07550 [Pseudomonadota bacterium]